MNRFVFASTVLLATVGIASDNAPADRAKAAREAVAAYQTRLQTELAEALRMGGPDRGIEVCRLVARGISNDISKETGFKVGRTSSRVRNPKNTPDAWERKVLQSFESAAAQGRDVGSLEAFEVVTQEGKSRFRYMKAIPAAPLCLACHGEDLSPEVTAKVKELYPKDRATGFKVGDVRGAFTLSQAVE